MNVDVCAYMENCVYIYMSVCVCVRLGVNIQFAKRVSSGVPTLGDLCGLKATCAADFVGSLAREEAITSVGACFAGKDSSGDTPEITYVLALTLWALLPSWATPLIP